MQCSRIYPYLGWYGNSYDPMTDVVGNNNMTSGWQTACKPGKPRLNNLGRSTKNCTWNVQTMYQAGKAENIIREMTKYNIDLLGITESVGLAVVILNISLA